MMDFDDILDRYQEVPITKRIAAIIFLVVFPSGYDFAERWGPLTENIKQATEEKANAERKLNDALEKHRQVIKLEQALAEKQLILKEASKKIPEEIQMDQLLQKTELISQEVGILMKSFEPSEEIPSESAFKYMKLPVRLNLVGSYGQLASFIDHMTHLDLIINVENLNIQPMNSDKESTIQVGGDFKGEERKKRGKLRLQVTCDLMVFRSMTQREEEALDAVEDAKKKQEQKVQKPAVVEPPA